MLIMLMAALLVAIPATGVAVIDGISGTTFSLTAKDGYINTGDGDSVYMWGYADGAGPMQYPGPTLILNQGSVVTVTLTNQLAVPVSIVFPGQDVTATGGMPGLITREAPPGGSVTYTFTVSQPGTYMYHSGTRPDLQVEMGLIGAIVVRPAPGPNCPAPAPDPSKPSRGYAYCSPDAYFDREYLFLLSDMDPSIHQLVETGKMENVDNTMRYPVLWFINGRNLPDTLAPAFASWLPNQPYNIFPQMHPFEKVLMRIIGGGRDPHPFHTHGANHLIIARDGRLLKTTAATLPDLAESDFTTTSVPGETVDAIYVWTGEKLGWDIYGHTDPTSPCDPTVEYCPDHGKPFPVVLPNQLDLTNGMFWSGSPFLGIEGTLPPGEGGFNPYAGIFMMWHSHNEKELTNNNIFVGGMATMAVIQPPAAPIP